MICASSSTIGILCAQAPEIVGGVSGNFLHCGRGEHGGIRAPKSDFSCFVCRPEHILAATAKE